jgi:hypothetical protein
LAKCRAHKAGHHTHVTESIHWKRDTETGHYRRITQEYLHHILEGTTKKNGKPITSENLFMVSTEDSYEHTMSYTGADGKDAIIYFKEIVAPG